jgi:putative PIN family toxin of toxin-antitoxin system
VRIVLDSNILVRAFTNSNGLAHQLLQVVLLQSHVLLLSNEMLTELSRVLRYPRLAKDHGGDEEAVYVFIGWLRHSAEIIAVNPLTVAPIRDSNDVVVLQTALTGEADVLCTIDRDFFEPPASTFLAGRRIAVLTDTQLMRILEP